MRGKLAPQRFAPDCYYGSLFLQAVTNTCRISLAYTETLTRISPPSPVPLETTLEQLIVLGAEDDPYAAELILTWLKLDLDQRPSGKEVWHLKWLFGHQLHRDVHYVGTFTMLCLSVCIKYQLFERIRVAPARDYGLRTYTWVRQLWEMSSRCDRHSIMWHCL